MATYFRVNVLSIISKKGVMTVIAWLRCLVIMPIRVNVILNDVAMKTIKESERLSLTTCKKILNKNGNNYTDEQIIGIRNWLYFMSEIALEIMEEKFKQNEKKE
ncbi:MAG TPA: hypothetical protein VLB84_03080 [Bacteroidia bacterium]|nr:hypothetical protein [Bacteroidia bacterium]